MARTTGRSPDGDSLVYVVRTHGDQAAVLLRTPRGGVYEAYELREPYSVLVERLHREDASAWHVPIAHGEHQERRELERSVTQLTAERDEARAAVASQGEELGRLRAEVNRLRRQ